VYVEVEAFQIVEILTQLFRLGLDKPEFLFILEVDLFLGQISVYPPFALFVEKVLD